MTIDWKPLVDAIQALVWPVVAAFALFLLRRPLIELVGQLARRASKISVFQVSLDLAKLPELRPSWAVGSADARALSPADLFDSHAMNLYAELSKPGRAEYAKIDLGAGEAWLTSRLFIFALVLGEVKGMRAFVFLDTSASVRHRFLGVATPSDIRRELGKCYPWLEEAYAKALRSYYQWPVATTPPKAADPAGTSADQTAATPATPAPTSDFTISESPLSTSAMQPIVRWFLSALQRSTTPIASENNSYRMFRDEAAQKDLWERTTWINGELLERILGVHLKDDWVEDSPDEARSLLSEAILRRQAQFVALVDSDRKFRSLVDRYALLAESFVARNDLERRADQHTN